MPQVFDNRMVAHVWAQQTQDSGRSNNGQFYFDGPTLYSYGSHYIVGRIMPGGTALLNSDKYSPTTGKHQGYAINAVRGRYFRVPELTSLANSRAFTDKDFMRRAVQARVGKMSDDAAHYLLSIHGDKPAVWARMVADKVKSDLARAKKELKAQKDVHFNRAKRIAELTESEWMDEVNRIVKARPNVRAEGWWRGRFDHEGAAEIIKTLRPLLAEVRRRGRKTAIKVLERRMAGLKALRAKLQKDQAGYTRRSIVRGLVETLRVTQERTVDSLSVAEARREEIAFVGLTAVYPKLFSHNAAVRRALVVRRLDELRMAEARAEFEKQAERRDRWLTGGLQYNGSRLSDEHGGALLRVYTRFGVGDSMPVQTLQTGWGAEVPLEHALKAFEFVRRCVERGEGWEANGRTIKVGHFTVDSISAEGKMIAGCHVINYAEMQRIAKELGV